MKRKTKKEKNSLPTFLSDLDELRNFDQKKAVVGGNLTFLPSFAERKSAKDLGLGLVELPPRDAGDTFLSNLRKSAPKFRVFAKSELFDFKKARFAFLVDAYLSYGLRSMSKDERLVIIGGIERTDKEFPINILVFGKGGLIASKEENLSAVGTHGYAGDCASVVQSLLQEHERDALKEKRVVRIVIAAPLSPWSVPGVEYEPDIPFNKLSFRPLTAAKAAQERYGLPIAAVIAGVAIFTAMIGDGWSELDAARERHKVANNNPAVKQNGGIDNSYIAVMTQRRNYMEAPRRQDLLSNKTMEIIRGISAVPDVTIIEIKMPAPGISVPRNRVGINPVANGPRAAAQRQPDVWMKVSVPKSNGPALYQSREVIRSLIRTTGMSIETSAEGWREENGRRIFVLEGTIHA